MHGADTDDQLRAGLDAVPVDVDVGRRGPGDHRRRRTQPQRLVQHRDGVAQLRYVRRGESALTETGDFCTHAVLDLVVVTQRPHRVRQGGRCGVVPSDHENDKFAADLGIRQLPAGLGIPGCDEGLHQRSIAVRIGPARLKDLAGKLMQGDAGGPCTAAGRCRQPPRYAERIGAAVGDIGDRRPNRVRHGVGV